jgi:putative membrane protein (TIGR04086 family)
LKKSSLGFLSLNGTGFKKEQITSLVMGVVIAYAITATIFIATAIVITYTNLSEAVLPSIVMVTCVLSVFVAGFDSSRKANKNGWAWGMMAGLLYGLIFVCIIIWASGGFVADLRKLMVLCLSVVGGGIGGAVGINFKK